MSLYTGTCRITVMGLLYMLILWSNVYVDVIYES
jgi:hypothetical protein